MKNNTIRLVQLMSDKELAGFRQHLALLKRSSMLKLFDEIQQPSNLEYDKEKVFETVFLSKYSEKKDYLLRNEFRLLSAELKKFVAIEKMKERAEEDSVFQNSFFLEWLSQKNEFDTEEKEIEKLIADANQAGDYYMASEVQKQYIDRYVNQKEITESNYLFLIKNIKEFYQTANKYYRYRIADIQIKQAFAERTLKGLNPMFEAQNIIPYRQAEKEKDTYLIFADLLVQAYCLDGKPKIELLNQALMLCDSIVKKGFKASASKRSLCAMIALEYFLSGDYANSITYHKKALQEKEDTAVQEIISYIYNYISTLLRIEKYEESIRVINDNEAVWNKIPRVNDHFLCLKAMSYIFLGNPDEAWKCIPHNRKRSGIELYYYYRFIQIIIYLIRNDYLPAISEAETFIHTIRNNDKNVNYLQLAILLKKYIVLLSEKNTLSRKTFTGKSNAILQTLKKRQKENETANHALLYRWLLRLIAKNLTSV